MDEIERWKFEVRQAMLDYASAEKRGDSAAIDATSTRACELVDNLAAKIAAERERCARLCEQMMDDSYTETHLGGEPADAADCAAAIRGA